ncbi:hypothetical protein Zmor_013171 [Zophobas morio]|uniref:Uncharacterized protein n=1 Tax=Zophobas morio TaxID=2755281 RepID=A0AA38IGX5_9CUCU|nr:hypothetical protein Zmor_013171 [Zophobas morio]
MELICRTCLKTGLSKNAYVNISRKVEINQLSFKDMLEVFMPEMDLDVSTGETVICLQCGDLLKNAYTFRNMCLQTETKIYDYLSLHNMKLGEKIDLHRLDLNFPPITNPWTDVKPNCLQDNSKSTQTDSNQNSLMFEDQSSQDDSDEDDKKVSKSTRARKRKRVNPRKESKPYNYNSLKRSYTCDLCEYKAYRLDLLNTHKLKHDKKLLNVKEYKCDFCMYSTTRKRSLDRHLFTHKGKSKHVCEFCKKTFAEKYQLKLHTITHTGEELPHKCEECGKGFLTNTYLKQHMETRHLAKEKKDCLLCNHDKCQHSFSRYYKCDMCEASFSDKRGLDAHKFTHTGGELPFKCLHCGFSTAWKGNLRKHLQNKH